MEYQKLLKKKKKATEDGNNNQLALACKNLGDFYTQEGEYKKALKEYQTEADLHDQLNNRLKYAIANRWIGESFMSLEDFDTALKHVEIYLKISLELDDKIEAERAYTSLGRVYLAIGQTENDQQVSKILTPHKALKQAEKCFIKGVLLCKELVGRVTNHELVDMKARLYLNLSLTKENDGEMSKAQEYMTKAIALCKGGELYDLLHKCYMAMSSQYVKLNENQNALRYISLAVEVADRLSNRVAKLCETWIANASILIKSGDYQSAKPVLMKAYKLKTPIESDRETIETTLRTVAALCKTEDELIVVYARDFKKRRELYEKMGDGSCALGNYEKAAMYYEQTLVNAKENREKDSQLIPIYVSLYETYRDMKSYKKALKYMWEEFELSKDIPQEAVYTLLSIAETTTLSGEATSVTEGILKQALKSAKDASDLDLQAKVYVKLSELYSSSSDAGKVKALEQEIQKLGLTLTTLKERAEKENQIPENNEDTPNIGDEITLDQLSDSGSEPDADEEETKEMKRTSLRKRTAMSNKIKRNAKGETELHTACITGNVASVKRLLNAGHPQNIRDNVGWLPLHEAANHGFYEVVSLLLDNGGTGTINDRACDGITPLHDACSNGHLEIVELLLDKGANPTIRTDAGETTLEFLNIWREGEGEMDAVRESFYETLRVRLSEALKKVCLSDAPKGKKAPLMKTVSRGLNKENNLKIGNLRMGLLDEDEESSNDSIGERTRSTFKSKKKNSEATAMYKSAISNLRHNSNPVAEIVDQEELNDGQNKRSAYMDSQEFDDDWLDEDVPMHEKKKRRFIVDDPLPKKSTISLSLTKKDPKRSVEKTPQQIIDVDEPIVIQAPKSNSTSSDAFDVIMNSKQLQGKGKSNSSNRRSSLSSSGRNQSSLIQAGFSRTVFDEDDDEHGVNDSGITSPVKSNRSSSFNVSSGSVSGFITMKVKIEDQLIVVPVKAAEVGNYTMKWLSENAGKRYENIHGRLPYLSLCTTDGAIFDENDPLEIVMDMKPYISTTIKRWTQKSLSDSYVACSGITKQDVNNGILLRLQSTEGQNVVDLSKMNLSADDMEALLKSLQNNTEVVRFDLSNNLIDDQGVINVCQAVASLPKLRSLNLSANLLTVDGIMKMDNLFSRMNLPELSELNLSFNRITDGGVKYVSRICNTLRKLSKLSLKSCSLSSFEGFNLAFDQLVSLELSHNHFLNLKSLWGNLKLDMIRELDFDLAISNIYTDFPKDLIEFLRNSGSSQLELEKLSLANCNLSDSHVWELLQVLKNSRLKHLSLMNNPKLSSMSLKKLLTSNLPLEYLNLRGCQQMLTDLKEEELSELNCHITQLPNRLILSTTGIENKYSIAASLKDLWSGQFGFDRVKLDQSLHTLIITGNQ